MFEKKVLLKMNTKVQKKKCNGSKKKHVTKLKSVLGLPYPKYWPEINEESVHEFISLVKNEQDCGKMESAGIIAGLNASLRFLKTGKCHCLLISSEIKPKFIISQIIFYVLRNQSHTQVLIVPNLKIVSQECFQIGALALSFSKNNEFQKGVDWCTKTAKLFPKHPALLEYYNSGQGNPGNIVEIVSKNLKRTEEPSSVMDFDSLYLRKKAIDSERSFVPNNSKDLKPLQFELSSETSDFISFSGNIERSDSMQMDTDEASRIPLDINEKKLFFKKTQNEPLAIKRKSRNNSTYLSLIVKKVQANPDRRQKNKK